jgi:rSAM/selenodomain-associated transferase 1
MMSRQRILFFVKQPQPGRVKTRLAVAIGDEQAAQLYRCFVRDMLDMLRATDIPVSVHFTPPECANAMQCWLGNDMPLVPQRGDDLGQRMAHGFAQAFSHGVQQAVLVGSDLPDLPPDTVIQAFDRLTTHHAALAPATDGGYYLIGFNRERYVPDVFADMAWSTGTVFAWTMERMQRHGLRCASLLEWPDVDTPDDLRELQRRLARSPGAAARTAKYLNTIMPNEISGAHET